MGVSTPTRARLDSLTGLRALAAAAVFLDHVAGLNGGLLRTIVHRAGWQGAMGVTFFFALSGFVLTWSARSDDTAVAFWRRRIARIYPAYLVALVVGYLVVRFVDQDRPGVGPTVTSVLMLQSWVPSEDYYFSLNGVSWSLSCEAFFYALFPLALPLLSRLSTTGRRRLQVVLLVLLVTFAIVGHFASGWVVNGSWFAGKFPVTRSAEFLLGATVAIDVLRKEVRRVPFRGALALVGGLWLADFVWVGWPTNIVLPIVPFLLLLVAAAQRDIEGRGTFFSRPAIVWLGAISYAFYLVHQLVIRVMVEEFGTGEGPVDHLLRDVTALLLGVLAAALLHELVEVPADRLLRGRRPAPAPVTAPTPDVVPAAGPALPLGPAAAESGDHRA